MDELLNDTGTWALISGIGLPYLIALVNQPHWSTTVRKIVAVIGAVLGGLVTSLATGAFQDGPGTVIGAVGIVLVSSQTVYAQLVRPSARKLERKTSTKKARRKAAAKEPPPPSPPPEVVDDTPGRHSADRLR